jgi:hypothetical protein
MNCSWFQQFLISLLPYPCLFVSGCKLQHKNADPRKKLSNDSDEAIIYTKPEDEIFHRVLIPKLCPPTKKKVTYISTFVFVWQVYIYHGSYMSLVTGFFPNAFQISLWSFSFPLHAQQPSTNEVSIFSALC